MLGYPVKVTIITACWNSEGTIACAMKSLQDQTYEDIEHIVVDASSVDRTLEIIHEMKLKNTKVISERDDGIYSALNKGIALATGDIIGFLHSDDAFANSATISTIVTSMIDKKANSVYGDLEYVSATSSGKVVRVWRSMPFNPWLLNFGWMPPHPTFFMKRTLYAKLGGFVESFKISGDYESLVRYFLSDELNAYYLPEVICKMKMGGVSNRSLSNILVKMREDFAIMKMHGLPAFRCLICKNIIKLKQFFPTNILRMKF